MCCEYLTNIGLGSAVVACILFIQHKICGACFILHFTYDVFYHHPTTKDECVEDEHSMHRFYNICLFVYI